MLGELEEKVQIKQWLSKSVHQLSSNIATALLVLTLFSIENPSTQLSNLSLLTQFAAVGKQEAYCAEQKRRQNVVQKYMYVVKRVFSVLFVLQLIEKTTIRHTLRDAPIATRLVGGPQQRWFNLGMHFHSGPSSKNAANHSDLQMISNSKKAEGQHLS